jgi:hypothetical protein
MATSKASGDRAAIVWFAAAVADEVSVASREHVRPAAGPDVYSLCAGLRAELDH